jgi:hypothetical protein
LLRPRISRALFNPKFQGAFEPYGVSDFDRTNFFTGVRDTATLTHEISEWLDDPGGDNRTPSWGHIGQVGGCQANLEVGDPLSGNIYPVTMNGFQYHVQDEAFMDWFYDTSPSIGSNGWYSLYGSGSGDTSFKTHFAKEPCAIKFMTLYTFCSQGGSNCTDGAAPEGDLLRDASGNIYGTTNIDGTNCNPSNRFRLRRDGVRITVQLRDRKIR